LKSKNRRRPYTHEVCINIVNTKPYGNVLDRSICNYLNKIFDVSSSLNGFKASIRKSKADLEAFSFNKEVATVTMKSKAFNYF